MLFLMPEDNDFVRTPLTLSINVEVIRDWFYWYDRFKEFLLEEMTCNEEQEINIRFLHSLIAAWSDLDTLTSLGISEKVLSIVARDIFLNYVYGRPIQPSRFIWDTTELKIKGDKIHLELGMRLIAKSQGKIDLSGLELVKPLPGTFGYNVFCLGGDVNKLQLFGSKYPIFK